MGSAMRCDAEAIWINVPNTTDPTSLLPGDCPGIYDECEPDDPLPPSRTCVCCDTGCTTHYDGGFAGGATRFVCSFNVTVNLGRMGPSTVLPASRLRIRSEHFTPTLYSPQSLGCSVGMMISAISTNDLTTNGVPRTVTVLGEACEPMTFEFPDNVSTGAPTGKYVNRADRLLMKDVDLNPTITAPAYYDLVKGDGEIYRYGADPAEPSYKGLILFVSEYGREAIIDEAGIKVIRDEYEAIRQVSVPQCLVDVVVTATNEYEMRFYTYANKGLWTNGIYHPQGDPYVIHRIGPVPGIGDSVLVTEVRGSKTNETEFTYEAATQEWKMERGDAATETLSTVEGEGYETEAYTVQDSTHADVLKWERKYHTEFPWGKSIVENKIYTGGGPKVTTYAWYETPGDPGYKHLKSSLDSDGGWARYLYSSNGFHLATIGPWNDAPPDAQDSVVVVTNEYTPHVPEDVLKSWDRRPRTSTTLMLGNVVSKRYSAYYTNAFGDRVEVQESCLTGDAPYGDTNNLRTVIIHNGPNADLASRGRARSRQLLDGRMETYIHEYGQYIEDPGDPATNRFVPDEDGYDYRLTVVHGTVDSPSGIPFRTTRKTYVRNSLGYRVLEETYVSAGGTNYERIGWTVTENDDLGHPVKIASSDGSIVEKTWGTSCCGIESQTDESGIEWAYDYDLLNRRTGLYKRNTAGTTNATARTYAYDAANRRVTETVSGGGLSQLISSNRFDLTGRVVSSVDATDIETTHVYNDSQRKTSTVRAGITNVTVRHADKRTHYTEQNGVRKQTYEYGVNTNGTQWATVYTGPDGTSSPVWTKTTVDMLGRTVKTERPAFGGGTLVGEQFYDSAGRLIRSTHPAMPDTLYVYNALGELTHSGLDVDGDGTLDLEGPDRVTGSDTLYWEGASNDWWRVSTSVIYANETNGIPTTNGISRTRLTGFADSEIPNLKSEMISTDIHGSETASRTTIDHANKTITQTAEHWDSTHDAVAVTVNGLLLTNVTKTALTYIYAYDGLERRTGTTDPRTGTAVTHYNAKGQVDWTEDAASNRTSYAYSPITGRRVAVTNALGHATHYHYGPEGQLLAIWGATYPVAYDYDDYDRMSAMYTYRGTNTITSYSEISNLKSSMDRTRWLYDEATGLLTNKLYADDNGPTYSYTSDGKLHVRTWARGETTTYTYDLLNQLTNINYSAKDTPDVSFTHDRLGRQTTITDALGTRTLTYTDALQLGAETNALGVLSRSYDAHGRNAGFTVDGIHAVAYDYGVMGRFDGVAWTNSTLGGVRREVDYSYAPNSDLVSGWTTGAGGLAVGCTYEANRNLIAGVSNKWNGTVLSKYTYLNDEVGRRTNRVDSGTQFPSSADNEFGYNIRGELTDADMDGAPYAYAYDPIGNRLTASNSTDEWTYLVNALNQYTNVTDGTSADLLYDSDGNLTNDGTRVYFWNGENRLTAVQPVTLQSGDIRIESEYDYMGRRVVKRLCGWSGSVWTTNTTLSYLYDGWNLVQETADTGSSASTNWYVWGLDLSGTLQGAGGIGGLLAKVTDDGGTYFATFDANGNVSEYIDESTGNVAAHYEYGPYGGLTQSSGTMDDEFAHRFSTKYYDSPTSDSVAAGGLYYYGYRYYSPELGRWPSRDPIGERGGRNLYGFVGNAPIGLLDPLGLASVVSQSFSIDYQGAVAMWRDLATVDISLEGKNICVTGKKGSIRISQRRNL